MGPVLSPSRQLERCRRSFSGGPSGALRWQDATALLRQVAVGSLVRRATERSRHVQEGVGGPGWSA